MKTILALLLLAFAANASRADDIYLSTGVKDVLKLSKSSVDSKVIESFVQNSSVAYNPTADEIIYLHKEGVGDNVIAALLKRGGELRQQNPAPVAAMQQAPALNPATVIYQPASTPSPVATTVYYNSVISSPGAYYGSVISVPSYPYYSYYPGYSCFSPTFSFGFGFPLGYRGYGGSSPYRVYGNGYNHSWGGGFGYGHASFAGGNHSVHSSWSPASHGSRGSGRSH